MVFIVRRLGFYIITAWVAITVNFFIPHLMPGDPAEALIARSGGAMSGQALNALRAQFGLLGNPSIWTQYVRYWNQLFHGNFGISTSDYPETVTNVISSNLPWTLALVGVATVISFVLGTLIGVVVAWRRGSWLDGVLPASTFFQAVPYFFFGIVIMIVFGDNLHWFPDSGGYAEGLVPGWSWSFISSALEHSVLPGLTIVISSAAGWIVGMRNMMVTTMDEDYVLVAAAKGLPRGRVVAYAARNAILPSISSFALSLSFVVTGALLTEMVFNYPGIGTTLLNAVQAKDYPLLQGIFLVITFAVLAANLLAELVYVVLDPRTRQEG
jgi:peptide/nickel transport system permease protein